jgi:hypothetical protein
VLIGSEVLPPTLAFLSVSAVRFWFSDFGDVGDHGDHPMTR